ESHGQPLGGTGVLAGEVAALPARLTARLGDRAYADSARVGRELGTADALTFARAELGTHHAPGPPLRARPIQVL
ncbi:hypothetical protein, partial [Sporichthya sp.]|uniref:hypothetical protein n=1 Tax=Sporichthya sp. TaxID=65475 RepID=UPI00180E1472